MKLREPMWRVLFLLSMGPLAMAGCAPGSVDLANPGDTAAEAVRQGVDYAWKPQPSPQALRAAGYTFASRYLSHDPSKNITAAEADALIAVGIDVVSNWETTADRALDGFAAGASDAREADAQAVAAGMPPSRPIYFSVDFDASEANQPAISAYLDGAASVIGKGRVGAYGGYYVIKRSFDAGKIAWGWQTFAWSGGQWDVRAQMRQVQVMVTIDGGDCDLDQAQVADFGQWGHDPVQTSCGRFTLQGGIAAEYASLGGCSSFLGEPTTIERATPDGVGRYNRFQNGSIYWTPATGAHELHGVIYQEWKALGWERGLLGYPTSDETASNCGGGRFNNFENGAITWSPSAGAHETHGAIRDRWQALGFECSTLGFPTSDLYAAGGGSRQDFEGGYITQDASGVVDHR